MPTHTKTFFLYGYIIFTLLPICYDKFCTSFPLQAGTSWYAFPGLTRWERRKIICLCYFICRFYGRTQCLVWDRPPTL